MSISGLPDVGALSLDWLNRRLYWIQRAATSNLANQHKYEVRKRLRRRGQNKNVSIDCKIVRWDIESRTHVSVISDIASKPRDLVVDPIMG